MNIKFLLFALSAAAISSCSTAYKSGQTPDDVYYSPVKVVEEDIRHDNDKQEMRTYDLEERQIRMAVYDRRWRDFDDDYNYRYDPYKYGYSYGYYYNPYYCYYPVYITNVRITNPKNTVPRMTNLGSYNTSTYAMSNTKYGTGVRMTSNRAYNISNNNNNGFIRRILTTPSYNTNNNSNQSTNNSTRSYTPSSGSSNSGSSSGSSGTSVSRPGRGG